MKTMTNQSGVTDLPPEHSARVVEEFEQPRYSRRDTLLTMFGVLMVMLLGSLDQTIVATALPHVIADLHGFDRYTWVSTAYLLASTAALTFFRSIGGTIALAAMGSVMNSAYLPAFNNALPPAIKQLATAQPRVAQLLGIFHNPQVLLQPDSEAQLLTQATHQGSAAVTMFNQVIESVKVGLAAGIHDVFLMIMVIMVVGTIAVLFLKEIPLRGGRQKATETPGEETPKAESNLPDIGVTAMFGAKHTLSGLREARGDD